MSSYSPTQYTYTSPLPIMPMPGSKTHSHHRHRESTYSVSPPGSDNASSGGASYSVPSGYSATTASGSSYAGSTHGDYDSERSASGVDFNEYMHEHLATAFDPLGLDKAVATQAQT